MSTPMPLQFGIKEVLNVTLYDFASGTPLLYADYASETDIDSKSTRLQLRGGQGNFQLLSFD